MQNPAELPGNLLDSTQLSTICNTVHQKIIFHPLKKNFVHGFVTNVKSSFNIMAE